LAINSWWNAIADRGAGVDAFLAKGRSVSGSRGPFECLLVAHSHGVGYSERRESAYRVVLGRKVQQDLDRAVELGRFRDRDLCSGKYVQDSSKLLRGD